MGPWGGQDPIADRGLLCRRVAGFKRKCRWLCASLADNGASFGWVRQRRKSKLKREGGSGCGSGNKQEGRERDKCA